MILHTSLAGMRRLSIPRDTEAVIPGHDTQKINAAYALGGRSLMVETVEGYMGNDLKINHVMEIDFKGFPKFIDSIGGVTVNGQAAGVLAAVRQLLEGPASSRRARTTSTAPRRSGGRGSARTSAPPTRPTSTAPRASSSCCPGCAGQLISLGTLFRAPWVAWSAPKAFKTDLHGPGLLALGARRGDRRHRRLEGARAVVPGLRRRAGACACRSPSARDAVERLKNGS